MNLVEKLEQKMVTHESEHIRNLAKEFDTSELKIVESLAGHYKRLVPASDFEKIWKLASQWEEALFFIDKEFSIVELSGRLPEGKMMGPMFNIGSEGSLLNAHIIVSSLEVIYLLRKPLFGKESLSIAFYAKDGSNMFSLYTGREKESRAIIPSVQQAYEELWSSYS